MLRGPQTPGELNQRTARLHAFSGLDEIHEALDGLTARGLIERLERRPGQKEERYRHLLGADEQGSDTRDSFPAVATARVPLAPAPAGLEERVAALEEEGRAAARGRLGAHARARGTCLAAAIATRRCRSHPKPPPTHGVGTLPAQT
jgi:uncharacterized protein YceH (UPF0502 family)